MSNQHLIDAAMLCALSVAQVYAVLVVARQLSSLPPKHEPSAQA